MPSKIKISMACVYNKYEVKIKMVQLKIKFLLDYNVTIVI